MYSVILQAMQKIIQLIMFMDTSEQAYGTCAYARWELPNGKCESGLITTKGRVPPVKKILVDSNLTLQ